MRYETNNFLVNLSVIYVHPDDLFSVNIWTVNIKWGKQTFKDIDLDTGSDAETFKAILYGLSNVPVDKQKVMIKGKVLKDSDDLTKFGIKNGMTLMMMGTAEEQGLREPAKPV